MENEWREKEEAVNPMDVLKDANRNNRRKTNASEDRPDSKKKLNRQSLLIQVLNGEILTRDFIVNNLGYIFFLFMLMMLMVAKVYYGKQLQKDITDLQTEVDATTAEYIENKAKLEESTTRYRLRQELEKRGLFEMTDPAKVIRVKKVKE